MFTSELSPEELRVLYGLAQELARADENLQPRELEVLKELGDELARASVTVPEIDSSEIVATIGSAIKKRRSQALILLELAALAYVDGEYSEPERDFIRHLGDKWDINRLTIYRIEAWGESRVHLAREAEGIMKEVVTKL